MIETDLLRRGKKKRRKRWLNVCCAIQFFLVQVHSGMLDEEEKKQGMKYTLVGYELDG